MVEEAATFQYLGSLRMGMKMGLKDLGDHGHPMPNNSCAAGKRSQKGDMSARLRNTHQIRDQLA